MSEKVVRKDVVRNRARLVEAAREVFAARGFDATLDDVARHAGVGTGTAYRHFANKGELAAEVIAEVSSQIVVDARNALEIEDPWLALVSFFETTAARQAVDRGLHEALTGQGDAERQRQIWPEIIEAVATLFARARAAGVVRPDAGPTDSAVIFGMLGPAYEISTALAPDLWRRYLALLLDGLRATDRPPLPTAAPRLEDVLPAITAGRRRPPLPTAGR